MAVARLSLEDALSEPELFLYSGVEPSVLLRVEEPADQTAHLGSVLFAQCQSLAGRKPGWLPDVLISTLGGITRGTFLEFNYMLLQSYDFLELHRAHDVSVQLGGDDQWSNTLAGADLVRRVDAHKAFSVTTPLLTTSDGRKMGKTEKGAVWLDARKTSPFDFFQYWRNVEDASVRKCLLYLTEIPVEEIDALVAVQGAQINEAKIRLAFELTALVHGRFEATRAKEAAQELFAKGGSTGNEPEILIEANAIAGSVLFVDLLVLAQIVPSKTEARRLIQQGGLSLDGEKVSSIQAEVLRDILSRPSGCLIQKGRKNFYRVRI